MYTKQEIILKNHREGKSQLAISRELGISRKTVKRYILELEAQFESEDCPQNAVTKCLSSAPTYHSGKREKKKLTKEVCEAIDGFLAANEEKKQQGLRKQLLKKCDIHALLIEQGMSIGYTSVCNYIKSKKDNSFPKEAFIRQDYVPGFVCEFDWGEIKLFIDGKLSRTHWPLWSPMYAFLSTWEVFIRRWYMTTCG